MIGNDIVDLAWARQESNWRREGFLSKLFTVYEQQLIHAAPDPETMVWTLWSMKESAYKLIARETGKRFFAPQQLVCHLNKPLSAATEGSVFYQRTYQTQSIITSKYIASVAFSASAAQTFTHKVILFTYPDYQHQHSCIREEIKQNCQIRFSVRESNVQIQKDKMDVPMLIVTNLSGEAVNMPISLSHHGYYGSFAIIP